MKNEKNEGYINLYTNEWYESSIPTNSKYDFLLERNKNYMNYTALSFPGKKENITYEELHTRINEYARALHKEGIRKGDVVAVCVLNTPESVYLLYALDLIGAVVVGLSPLNNDYKMKRDIEMVKPTRLITLDMMYGKCKNSCDALNVSPILYSPIESMDSPFIKMAYNFKQMIEKNKVYGKHHNLSSIVKLGKNTNFARVPFEPNQVNDILFTGGSTGVHKGVELTSNGLNGVVKGLDTVLFLEPGMKHLGNIPFGHMVFGRLVLHYVLCKNMEFALTLNAMPNKFLEELIRTNADGAMGGPVHWDNLYQNPMLKKGCINNLKQAITGGEMLKPEKRKEILSSFEAAGLDIDICDGLGLTEMWAPTHVNIGGKNTPGTIGYPIGFVSSKVVDPKILENRKPNECSPIPSVTDGDIGLLLVTGPGMMIKYHNNEEETNKVFFYDEVGTKWYCTGDLVFKTGINNNEYKFAGRQKRNFVCGVDNIYPEQIEQIITELPEIRETVVSKVKDDKYQFMPVYHVCVQENCNTEQLKNKIDALIESTLGSSALPGYIFFQTDALVRTDNGKLNSPYYEQMDTELYEKNELVLVRKKY